MKSIFSSAARLLALCALTSLSALAQPGSGGPTPSTPTAPNAVPIDGGASLLLAGGVAFGLKQLRERRLTRRAKK